MEKAYEYLSQFERSPESKTQFTVSCSGSGAGIYLREPVDLEKPSVIAVSIEPTHYDGITGGPRACQNGAKHYAFYTLVNLPKMG